MNTDTGEIKKQLSDELFGTILPFWFEIAPDRLNGGFHGFIDNNNVPDPAAPKGLVMHARLLWTFSAVRRYVARNESGADGGKPETSPAEALFKSCLDGAARAASFLEDHLADGVHGGYWWQSDSRGVPVDRHKVVYGQAFALYAFSESLRVSDDPLLRRKAEELFRLLEIHARDRERGGYLEILNEDWNPFPEGRLSEADIPCHRSMNTNLHIIEAYTNYLRVQPDTTVAEALESAVMWFCRDIFNAGTGHLRLFLDAGGRSMEDIDSYGHDIEASWLIHEAAQVLGGGLAEEVRPVVLALGESAIRDGMRPEDPAMEYERHGGKRVNDRIWWVQAEAMVGSWNLYELTGDPRHRERAAGFWNYIRETLSDREHGEWFWGADPGGRPLAGREKAGMWKTPYHNGRACLEMLGRVGIE